MGWKYTIPQRLTVAGDAADKSSISNNMHIFYGIFRISPEVKHNFLLSSKTVFKFSIHKELTGPSNTIHTLPLCKLSLINIGTIPSDHYFVSGSNLPYNYSTNTALGFNLNIWLFNPFPNV